MFLLVLSVSVFAELKFDVSGDMQYRFRYDYVLERNIEDEDSSRTPDFQNRYAWNLRLKITPNEYLKFGFRLSNPSGYGTDVVGEEASYEVESEDDSVTIIEKEGISRVLSIPEAYFKWTPGVIDLSAGIIPVYSNTVLDMAAASEYGYEDACESTWKTEKNESQIGVKLGVNYLENDDLLLRSELVASMINDAKGSNAYDALVHDKLRLILNVPVELKKAALSIIPTGHFIINNLRSEDHKEASHTVEGGFEVKMQPIEKLSILLGAAGGLSNNDALKDDEDYVSSAPLGMLLKTKIRVIPSFGRLMAEFRYGRSRDRNVTDIVNSNLFHWDLKYAIPVKKLTIMPRFRAWYYFKSSEENSVVHIRPAIILKAAF